MSCLFVRSADSVALTSTLRAHAHTAEGTLSGTGATGGSSSSSKRRKRNGADGFSTAETLRRMEEDRERVRVRHSPATVPPIDC